MGSRRHHQSGAQTAGAQPQSRHDVNEEEEEKMEEVKSGCRRMSRDTERNKEQTIKKSSACELIVRASFFPFLHVYESNSVCDLVVIFSQTLILGSDRIYFLFCMSESKFHGNEERKHRR